MHGIPRYRTFQGPALFRHGFRPFFLGAGIWSAVAVFIWLAIIRGDLSLPTVFAPAPWHAHEMLFGFAAAAVAGFMLTAIPNWTGRLPLQGVPLIILFSVWVLGRVAMATSSVIGGPLAAVIDVAFLAILFLTVLREIVSGRNWRNLPMPIAVAVLVIANGLTQLEANKLVSSGMLGERLGLATIVLLISLVGGRIIPSFTRNWLVKRDDDRVPVPFGRFDIAVLFLVLISVSFWVASPNSTSTGAALIIVGLLSTARLARWRGLRTRSEPLLWILHLGYAWVAIGLSLLGFSILLPTVVPYSVGLHALSAGAIGTMTLAVMTRATRGHTGRSLTADPRTVAIYVLITLAAVLRVAASFFPNVYVVLLMSSGASWIGAFSLFVACYGPMLLTASPTRT